MQLIKEQERDPQPFPLPQMTQHVLGDGLGVGTAASKVQHGSSLAFLWRSLWLCKQPHVAPSGRDGIAWGWSQLLLILPEIHQSVEAGSQPPAATSALPCPLVRLQQQCAMPRQPVTFWLASLSCELQSYFTVFLQLL